jgi:hypothetical protein
MIRRLFVVAAVAMFGVAEMPAAVSAAETGTPPCAFALSAPHVVQMQGSDSAEQCDMTEGPGTAQVYYAPYRPGATHTATGRRCASTGNPPRSVCQTSGPLTTTL